MSKEQLPPTMRIWEYAATDGGLEKNLKLHSAPLPKPTSAQHLIQVLAVGLNPVDYKPAEAFIGRLMVKKPATPGFDIAGRIITPASGSNLSPGQLVFGAASTNPLAGSGLAEYVAAPTTSIAPLPSTGDFTPLVAAGTPVAAVTAYDSLIPFISPGTRVFLNGGSGGVGTYAIQIAKAAGAHVTVSCSARNAELCRSLGADEVLDYNASPSLLEQLRAQKQPLDHVVDNVFSDPALFFEAHTYTSPHAKFIEVASGPTLGFMKFALRASLLPGFLGGGKRKFVVLVSDIKGEKLEKIAGWVGEGKIKPVTDQVFGYEDVVGAFTRLKTGRARGKVVVEIVGGGQ